MNFWPWVVAIKFINHSIEEFSSKVQHEWANIILPTGGTKSRPIDCECIFVTLQSRHNNKLREGAGPRAWMRDNNPIAVRIRLTRGGLAANDE